MVKNSNNKSYLKSCNISKLIPNNYDHNNVKLHNNKVIVVVSKQCVSMETMVNNSFKSNKTRKSEYPVHEGMK